MVKTIQIIAVTILLSQNSQAYESDWGPKEFYEAVNYCRTSIVLPAANDYKERGIKHGRQDTALDEEVLRMTPIFDYTATAGCFCVVNELAKDHPARDFPSRIDLEAYIQTPRCKAEFRAPISELDKNREDSKIRMLP